MLFRSDRKSTRLNSSHTIISYAVFCLKKKDNNAESLRFVGRGRGGLLLIRPFRGGADAVRALSRLFPISVLRGPLPAPAATQPLCPLPGPARRLPPSTPQPFSA